MRRRKFAEIGVDFEKELKQIKALRRIDVDKDLPRELSNARITDGMIHFPEWKLLKERLVREPRKEKLRLF